jgi:hypothetical protein
MTSVPLRLASLPAQGGQRSVAAEPAGLAIAAYDGTSYSTRDCSCGSAMRSIPAARGQSARWQCPTCGKQKRR